ncbi:hypothetical protein HUT11_35530 (plasmid) [Streptomyces seoulensis]|nr:hypothetical protein HUT11_35530 [Streptomyces seoulensis]
MFNLALDAVGWTVLAVAIAGIFTGVLAERSYYGYLAISMVVLFLRHVLVGHTIAAGIHTAGVTWAAWKWWNSGGGDGARRRLRKWARQFRSVRRTAPAGAL